MEINFVKVGNVWVNKNDIKRLLIKENNLGTRHLIEMQTSKETYISKHYGSYEKCEEALNDIVSNLNKGVEDIDF